ncbi:hypothetical protein [Planomicrobium sp. Y74]|uniref:hypothetical protein n=1 Tax=Planomicrobium sp. Y74 TaxID=2478977 RepID=UPI000EF48C77|nr:hypothetical protein [Planomicrobium sp. Y74]RLQ92066.1 hypothetical protein D9754_04580 [Planomicrobium sp. Y74]
MEPLIVALILMAVSAFFGGKKKEGGGGSSPKRSSDNQPNTRGRAQGGFKRMEDYAREMYGEFQTQMNPETDKKEQVKEVAREVVQRSTNRRPERRATPVEAKEIGGRLSAHQSPPVRPVRKAVSEENRSPFPLTQNEAQKAIILAEVFMPPKAKRR